MWRNIALKREKLKNWILLPCSLFATNHPVPSLYSISWIHLVLSVLARHSCIFQTAVPVHKKKKKATVVGPINVMVPNAAISNRVGARIAFLIRWISHINKSHDQTNQARCSSPLKFRCSCSKGTNDSYAAKYKYGPFTASLPLKSGAWNSPVSTHCVSFQLPLELYKLPQSSETKNYPKFLRRNVFWNQDRKILQPDVEAARNRRCLWIFFLRRGAG